MKYKTDRPFTQNELINMDVIHDPNPQLFIDQNEESYVVKDFINELERKTILDFFIKNLEGEGLEINNHIFQ